MEVWAKGECVYKSKFRKRNNCILNHNKEKDLIELQFEYCPVLVDDIKVRFCSRAVRNIFSILEHEVNTDIFPFFKGRVRDPVILIPDHCLSLYFTDLGLMADWILNRKKSIPV